MRTLFATSLLALASAKTLLRAKSIDSDEVCGKGFDSLNDGSKAYFATLQKLWTHPGNKEGFGTFEAELKCWFAALVTQDCFGMPSQADARKKQLAADCADVTKTDLDIWKQFSKDEFVMFKRNYPADNTGDHGGQYREVMATAKTLNTKEILCSTLFVIDDGCVDSKYIRLPPPRSE